MTELTKYQKLKMYLPVNGYDSVKDLAEDWGVTSHAIRNHCRDKFKSERLDEKISEFIKSGDEKFQQHRSTNTQASASH